MSADIVVGVDGSEDARAALRWALDEGRLRGVHIKAVHAWDVYPTLAPGYGEVLAESESMEADCLAMLNKELAAVGASSDDVETLVLRGRAAHRLVELSKSALMVVLGSRGHGGFAGLLLGSTSQQVVHHAACPVVIIPHALSR